MTAIDVIFVVGARVLIDVEFKEDGTLVDPSDVVFKARTPAGVVTTYTVGTDDESVRVSQGLYRLTLDVEEAGQWACRCEGTGDYRGAVESTFAVKRSLFSD